MTTYADLEIGIRSRDEGGYAIDLRFDDPNSLGENRSLREGVINLDLSALTNFAASWDEGAYGRLLGQSLFADKTFLQDFGRAIGWLDDPDKRLRVRLYLDPSDQVLHTIRWETLRDPDEDATLFTGQGILFSRYLSSIDWRPVRLRPPGGLRALIVIANPSNLEKNYNLARVDVEKEEQTAKSGLAGITSETLKSGATKPDERPSLSNIMVRLRSARYDILYLVCHGALIKGEPKLWLDDDQGAAAVVPARELAAHIRDLAERPALVVMASCQSAGSGEDAGTGDNGALAGAGPVLARVGVPAVIAMQGNIKVKTSGIFMKAFFNELRQHGQIDLAMAAARSEALLQKRKDWWAPALFLRIKTGRIWYERGLRDLQRWPALLDGIHAINCVPIIGSGLLEPILGPLGVLSRRWAESYRFPMAPYLQENLTQVAQFIAIFQQRITLQSELGNAIRHEIQEKFKDSLPAALRDAKAPPDLKSLSILLMDLIREAGKALWRENPAEAHAVLARLPVPVYITTNPDNLLAEALCVAGKAPSVLVSKWNEGDELPTLTIFQPGKAPVEASSEQLGDLEPTVEAPLVYHLFGHISDPDSLVLTEDDHFNFLIKVTENPSSIPSGIRARLAASALLFVGFQLDDWDFRVVFRSIVRRAGGAKRNKFTHVAAQLDPVSRPIIDPERARKYLEDSFRTEESPVAMNIYWGTIEDFVSDLVAKWAARFGEDLLAPGGQV